MKRRRYHHLVALLLAMLVFCACQPDRTPEPTPTPMPTVAPLLLRVGVEQEIVPLIARLIDEHRRQVPHILIDLTSGTPAQLGEGVETGSIDLAIIPRQVLPSDMLDSDTPESMLAADLPVLIVHPDNQLENLSTQQAQAMLTGRVTSWSDLGARAGVPEIVVTPPDSSLGMAIKQSLLGNKANITSAALLLPTGREIVGYVGEHPQAIGVALLSQADDSVRVLTIDGFAPSWEHVQTGDYALALGWEPIFHTYAPGEADGLLASIETQLKSR